MKYIITFLFLILLNTMTLAGTIPLPVNIDGATYEFQVLGKKTAENPNAGIIYRMHFNQSDYTYHYSKYTIHGNYTYKLLDQANGIAIINCHEIFNNIPTHYLLLLKATSTQHGAYIYQQASPQKRMNFGFYTLQ